MGLETRLMVMGRVRVVEGTSWVEGEGEAGVEQLRTMLRTNQAFLASMGSGGEHLGMVRELVSSCVLGRNHMAFLFLVVCLVPFKLVSALGSFGRRSHLYVDS